MGKTAEPMYNVLWEDGEPCCPGSQDCMGSWSSGGFTGKFHDCSCVTHVEHFACEKVL